MIKFCLFLHLLCKFHYFLYGTNGQIFIMNIKSKLRRISSFLNKLKSLEKPFIRFMNKFFIILPLYSAADKQRSPVRQIIIYKETVPIGNRKIPENISDQVPRCFQQNPFCWLACIIITHDGAIEFFLSCFFIFKF